MPRQRLIAVFALVVTTTLGACSSDQAPSAPGFRLAGLEGGSRALAEREAEVLVLNFWASWCKPCRKEMPELDKLYQRYRDQGLAVWGISVDARKDKALEFIDQVEVSFPLLHDPKMKVSDQYNVHGMPATVVIGPDGRIRLTRFGYDPDTLAKIEKVSRRLLREQH